MAASAEYTAWTMTDTRLKQSASPIPEELHMDDDPTADEQAYSSSGKDVGGDHIPIASALNSTYTPPPENLLLAQISDMAAFMDCSSPVLNGRMPQTSHRSSGRCNPKVQRQQTTTVGGDSGHVTIQPDFFFNKDLEYLRYGHKMGRHALSISKMKAAYYPDVGLEQMVPDQMWIEEECKYDIIAMVVRTHMRILSVVRIEVFPMYGYNYMKKIVLRRADLKEYVIAERDSKYLYPSNFEDLYLLNLQGHLNHLSPKDKKILTTAINLWTRNLVIRQRVEDFQLGIESYQTQLNLTKPRWDAKGFEYKHDFTVIDSPRAITFRDKYGGQQEESGFGYTVLDEERRRQKQGVYVCHTEMTLDKMYLPESGKLCWWQDKRRRLSTAKENRIRG
ncbi:hypothetical protein Tco_0385032 [Tanacetum coccineum]